MVSNSNVETSIKLFDEMEQMRENWKRGTKRYGGVYAGTRIYLVIASAIVAAEKTLSGSPVDFFVTWVPVFALTVTIITALDTWIKPRDKWRGFMEDRDDLADLVYRADQVDKSDKAALDGLRRDCQQLLDRHREQNVF